MDRFFQVKTVAEVLGLLDCFPVLPEEEIDLARAWARVLAADWAAPEDLPEYDRSAMDGYAVRAADTFGTSEGMPGLFEMVGEVVMGLAPEFRLGPGRVGRIFTGGMLPAGADAVAMVEYSRLVDKSMVELSRPVAPGENVVRRGEDVRQGEVLLRAGQVLGPQDLGLLAALGQARVRVIRRPRVAILSTGDEVRPVTERPGPGQIRDVNTYTLTAMTESLGAEVLPLGLIPDDPARLRTAVAQGLEDADLILVSGGSSVGVRDYTVEVFKSFPGCEILVHGVAVSPGKPLIMARLGHKSLWGLPGHTVSALVAFRVFIRPLLARLTGRKPPPTWGRKVSARLTRNVPSVHGREDYIRVRIESRPDGLWVEPILGQSGLISTLVKADGLIRIERDREGLRQGTAVTVRLLD